MKRGEKWILTGIAVAVAGSMLWNAFKLRGTTEQDTTIPFYTTASPELVQEGSDLYKRYRCRSCHRLWTMQDFLQSVPAPAMDGIGSLRSEEWLFSYLSSDHPQSIVPSRLKPEYQMPSYAHLSEHERRVLAAYLASLRVKDWYLNETRIDHCQKLTGEACR
jgi:sulfur-oxidizing protein SoxX